MRLDSETRKIIKGEVASLLGPRSVVRLFGSRVDDEQKGGDIDPLIETPSPAPSAREPLEARCGRPAPRGDRPLRQMKSRGAERPSHKAAPTPMPSSLNQPRTPLWEARSAGRPTSQANKESRRRAPIPNLLPPSQREGRDGGETPQAHPLRPPSQNPPIPIDALPAPSYRSGKQNAQTAMTTLLSGLITSKTRIEILMRLFLNPDRRAHLRELAGELAVSPSQVKSELEHLSDSGLVTSAPEGNRIQFGANPAHPLFPELQAMVRKALGMDSILESILLRLGRLELALLVGDYALGRDSGCIDLVFVGDIDQRNLADLVAKTERQLERQIRVQVLSGEECSGLAETLA